MQTRVKRRPTRRSVSLSREIDEKVRALARQEKRSTSQVIGNLIEAGLHAKEVEKRRFFDLAERLRTVTDNAEITRLKEELARMTFGS